MAWFRAKGIEKGAFLCYQIKKGLLEVKDAKHIAMLKADPRFQELSSEKVAKDKKALATDSDSSKKESGEAKKEEPEKAEAEKAEPKKVKRTKKKKE